MAGRVVFAGRVSDVELRSYYRLANVTVLPSTTMGEAFGLVLVESLASANAGGRFESAGCADRRRS